MVSAGSRSTFNKLQSNDIALHRHAQATRALTKDTTKFDPPISRRIDERFHFISVLLSCDSVLLLATVPTDCVGERNEQCFIKVSPLFCGRSPSQKSPITQHE